VKGGYVMDRKRAILVAKDILATIVRNVHLRRELVKVCAEPKLNFWRVMYGNLTDTAALEWCKLFGSDDNETQPVHWKSIAQDQDRFREDMLRAIGVTREAWNEYWAEMKTYRDHAVAHFDPRQSVTIARYPPFDLALKSSYFYYIYLRAELAKLGEGLLPEDLEQYSLQFAKKCGEVAAVALNATKHISETAY
jgi:hypothetical protein